MTLLLAALALGINCILMVVFYRRLSARFSPDRVLGEIRGELDRLVADLGRETDRDVALLENRIQGLRSLIEEADRRILLAERETEKRRDEESTLSALSRPSPALAPAPALEPAPVPAPAPAPAPNIVESPNPASVESSVPTEGEYSRASIARARVSNGNRRVDPVIPVRERVLSLAYKGFSPDLIASNLSLSLGEVELILDMQQTLNSPNSPLTKDSSS